MAEDYKAIAEDVFKELKDAGLRLVFYRIQQGVYDPLEGSYGESTREDFTAFAILPTLDSQIRYAEGITVHNIERGDLLVKSDAIGYTPIIGDFLDYNGFTWIVQGFSISRPGGVPIMYTISLRRG